MSRMTTFSKKFQDAMSLGNNTAGFIISICVIVTGIATFFGLLHKETPPAQTLPHIIVYGGSTIPPSIASPKVNQANSGQSDTLSAQQTGNSQSRESSVDARSRIDSNANESLPSPRITANYIGTYKGLFSNPDSGSPIPWELTVEITGEGDEIAGTIVLARGPSRQSRKFTGKKIVDMLSIDAQYPYAQIACSGVYPCENMRIVLQGPPDALTGEWTATNCARGGKISLSKNELTD